MTTLAKLALGPLLLWQARGARKHAVALPEAAGPREGEVGDGPLLRLLIVGDSSAAGVGAATQDEALAGPLTRTLAGAAARRVRWQLIARSGASTAAAAALVERLRQCAGVRHVVFAALPPMHEFPLLPNPLRAVLGRDARRLDAAQATWAARRPGVSHGAIDIRLGREQMAADGFHPGPAVYRTCGEALALHIVRQVLPELATPRRPA